MRHSVIFYKCRINGIKGGNFKLIVHDVSTCASMKSLLVRHTGLITVIISPANDDMSYEGVGQTTTVVKKLLLCRFLAVYVTFGKLL